MKRITAVAAATLLTPGMMAGPAMANASENANCMGSAQSDAKGPFDKNSARSWAQGAGQNENSNGVGAFARILAQLDSSCTP
jgi:hypothetical protein